MDHKYPHGGVDYIFDQSNDQVLENIYSIFKCLENKLNIHPKFIYYNNNKDYNNMMIILYNFKDTPFLKKYNKFKNIIIENNIPFLEYTTILPVLLNKLKNKQIATSITTINASIYNNNLFKYVSRYINVPDTYKPLLSQIEQNMLHNNLSMASFTIEKKTKDIQNTLLHQIYIIAINNRSYKSNNDKHNDKHNDNAELLEIICLVPISVPSVIQIKLLTPLSV